LATPLIKGTSWLAFSRTTSARFDGKPLEPRGSQPVHSIVGAHGAFAFDQDRRQILKIDLIASEFHARKPVSPSHCSTLAYLQVTHLRPAPALRLFREAGPPRVPHDIGTVSLGEVHARAEKVSRWPRASTTAPQRRSQSQSGVNFSMKLRGSVQWRRRRCQRFTAWAASSEGQSSAYSRSSKPCCSAR
jgi:hypothetical protein